ncbi:hypothetical protein HPB49_025722 [Dermacentor silvarum]|nr:hypothetical protein HPB49_025722 [Dermacentor silvarum]
MGNGWHPLSEGIALVVVATGGFQQLASGRRLANLFRKVYRSALRTPLNAFRGRAAVSGSRHRDEILTIISILSGDSVLYFNEKQRERAAEVWRKFQSNEGDHVMLLNVYKAYKSVKGNKAWCKENFVNKKNMLKVIEIRSQLADLKCLASGLFTNVAELQKNGDYLTLDARKKVHIHPSSCLFSSSPACVVFTEMVETTKCYMRNLTVVDPDWLPDVAPQYFKKKRLGAKALS